MIRKIKKVDLILCSDIHLREDVPVCWIGDYQKEQWSCLDFISDLQHQHNCQVLNAGDLFDHWKPSPHLLSLTIQHLPNKFYTIYGQHDLPQHNLELSYKCGIYTLEQANKINQIGLKDVILLSWNMIPPNKLKPFQNILVWHKFTYKGKVPWPGCTDFTATRLLRKYPNYDLILTGDNHIPFVEEYEGRLLVNPGSMMRMDADQINHRPRVYLWYAKINIVEPVYLPIEPASKVMTREHIDVANKHNERMDAFITGLDGTWQATLNYEDNLQRFEKKNKVRQPVMDIVYKAIEI